MRVARKQAAPGHDRETPSVGKKRAALSDERYRHHWHTEVEGPGETIARTRGTRIVPTIEVEVDGNCPITIYSEDRSNVAHPDVVDRCWHDLRVYCFEAELGSFHQVRRRQQHHRLILSDCSNHS